MICADSKTINLDKQQNLNLNCLGYINVPIRKIINKNKKDIYQELEQIQEEDIDNIIKNIIINFQIYRSEYETEHNMDIFLELA